MLKKIKKWMKWHSFDSFSHLCWTLRRRPSFVSLHFISSSLNPAIMGGLQKVHLYRRKWPATPNWLEFSDSRFIEVMDLFCCLSSTPTLILKHWKIDLSHMTSVTGRTWLWDTKDLLSFRLWIFVTMTGHRAAVLLL